MAFLMSGYACICIETWKSLCLDYFARIFFLGASRFWTKVFSDASSFDSRPDERLAGCWLSLNITDDWIAFHFMVALATRRTRSIWWMRAQTCFDRHPARTFLELSATICSQSRVANQQIINNGSCAECWPQLYETSARSQQKGHGMAIHPHAGRAT